MTHDFDKHYWEQHWDDSPAGQYSAPPNPYVIAETRDLTPRTALDAGCGAGTESIWLAEQGWHVTAADISATALAQAQARAAQTSGAHRITWVEQDLTTWEPNTRWDLVVANYAHPSIPQLEFYRRIADWVAPAGTLLIVGHLHGHAEHGSNHHPPEEATATAGGITAGLDPDLWTIDTAEEHTRTVTGADGHHGTPLHDVVVRATRRR